MPYFHDNKNLFQCEQINKTKKRKPKPSLNLNSETYFELHITCRCEFFMSVFSVSREGGWEFHPFLRAALVQWDELLHVAKCFCSRQWFSNPLHHIHFQCGFVLFQRFQVLLLHSWFSLLGFGLCEYSLCNTGLQDSHRCCHTVHCSLHQVIVPTFWQVQVLQCCYSIISCHFCIHQTDPTEIYVL